MSKHLQYNSRPTSREFLFIIWSTVSMVHGNSSRLSSSSTSSYSLAVFIFIKLVRVNFSHYFGGTNMDGMGKWYNKSTDCNSEKSSTSFFSIRVAPRKPSINEYIIVISLNSFHFGVFFISLGRDLCILKEKIVLLYENYSSQERFLLNFSYICSVAGATDIFREAFSFFPGSESGQFI